MKLISVKEIWSLIAFTEMLNTGLFNKFYSLIPFVSTDFFVLIYKEKIEYGYRWNPSVLSTC